MVLRSVPACTGPRTAPAGGYGAPGGRVRLSGRSGAGAQGYPRGTPHRHRNTRLATWTSLASRPQGYAPPACRPPYGYPPPGQNPQQAAAAQMQCQSWASTWMSVQPERLAGGIARRDERPVCRGWRWVGGPGAGRGAAGGAVGGAVAGDPATGAAAGAARGRGDGRDRAARPAVRRHAATEPGAAAAEPARSVAYSRALEGDL